MTPKPNPVRTGSPLPFLLLVLFLPLAALAQTTTPANPTAPTTPTTTTAQTTPTTQTVTTDVSTGWDPLGLNLTSVTAVVTLTTLLVQRFVKPAAIAYPNTVGRVSTLLYTLLIATGLTFLANRYFITLPGNDVWRLIRDTIVSVLGAAGLYTLPEALKAISGTKSQGVMLKKDDAPTVQEATRSSSPEKGNPPPFQPGPRPPFGIVLLPLLFFLPGCASFSSDAFYNGVNAQWPPVRDTYNRLVAADQGLTPAEKQIELDSARNIDRLLAAEAKRRAATQPTNPPMPN